MAAIKHITNFDVYPNVILDFFHLEESSLENRNIFETSYIPTLNTDTRGLVTFDDGIHWTTYADEAMGNTFSIYREDNQSGIVNKVVSISNGNLGTNDYNIANHNEYRYYIYQDEDGRSSLPNISRLLTTTWQEWSVTNIVRDDDNPTLFHADVQNIWKLYLNLESGTLTNNINKTVYQNLTRYPKISLGKQNYATGTITCLLGEIVNEEYTEWAGMREQWVNFCNDGNLKLLKDIRGNKYLIDIIDTPTFDTMDETVQQATTISFNWIEVGDTNKIAVVE